nr:hypothetical protein [Tanacetum cinerariifolium]
MNVQAEINHLQEMLHLTNSNQDPPVDVYDLEGSYDRDMKIDSLTKEPLDSLLMGDEVISTISARETDKFIKSSVDDLVQIPKESKVTSDSDDSKPRSYDVTFSNSLFDLNDDFTLCNDNLLFDEEFEDISSIDPPKSAPLKYEPLGNPDSASRSLETSDLILKELIAEIGLDDSIPTEIDDGYYDSEGDILFLEHLLIEDTFFDLNPVVLPKKSTLLVILPLASKQFSLREVERFDLFSP